MLLDRAGREEEHLVRGHRRAEQGDGEVSSRWRVLRRGHLRVVARRPATPVGPSFHTATAKRSGTARRARRRSPSSRTCIRQMTSHTRTARRRDPQQVVDARGQRRASATPPISAVNVRKLMKNEASSLARPPAGPSRSRIRSNVGPPADGGHPAAHLGEDADPMTPTTTPRQRHTEPGAGADSRRGRRCRRSHRWR